MPSSHPNDVCSLLAVLGARISPRALTPALCYGTQLQESLLTQLTRAPQAFAVYCTLLVAIFSSIYDLKLKTLPVVYAGAPGLTPQHPAPSLRGCYTAGRTEVPAGAGSSTGLPSATSGHAR